MMESTIIKFFGSDWSKVMEYMKSKEDQEPVDAVGNILRIVDFLTSRPNLKKCAISIEDMDGDETVRCDISWEK